MSETILLAARAQRQAPAGMSSNSEAEDEDGRTEPASSSEDEHDVEQKSAKRLLIEGLYEKHNPSKLVELASLLEKYGEDRLLATPVAGTTRDPVDTELNVDDQEYILVDTAGMRRKRSIADKLEQFAVVDTVKAPGAGQRREAVHVKTSRRQRIHHTGRQLGSS